MRLVLAALALAAVAHAQFVNFGLSCSNISLVGTGPTEELEATCGNGSGGNAGAQVIPLSTCLTNQNGKLGCQVNGNAMNSCSGCALSNTTVLTCSCSPVSGPAVLTSFDLNTCIGNINGRLFC
ncbi:Cyanovirin-N [Exidia glandulosa HHB12029]|uniref:Cyanovirin-N n=1 Tax=Exidia glandulosa HHB12029 TaxID=1314781 RepID=A0A165QAA7_EXIGL|nr:Cyanovirin-N [Exidia glandulosa HHB12029]